MAHRTYVTMIGLVGLVLVAALLLAGASLARHAQQGPRWKRRLVGAGIMLLAALGLVPTAAASGCSNNRGAGARDDSTAAQTGSPEKVGSDAPPEAVGKVPGRDAQPVVADAGHAPPPDGPYAQTPEWRQIWQVLGEAEAVASGSRGPYPFDEAGQRRLLDGLEEARSNVARLRTNGLLGDGEAELLNIDLGQLASRVGEFRPTEMRGATCYEPMAVQIAAVQSMDRLGQRLPFLEKMGSTRALHPAVAEKVLVKIESDLAVLESPAEVAKLRPGPSQEQARGLATKVRAQVDLVRQRLRETGR